MTWKLWQGLGLVTVGIALAAQLQWVGIHEDQNPGPLPPDLWQEAKLLPASLGTWHGKPFEYESWVYSYIPASHLMGLYYLDPANPKAYVQVNIVHSTIREYLHDPTLCSYGQGIEETPLQTLQIPGSPVNAQLMRLKVVKTGQILYQLSWYQWGARHSQATFWGWLPQALTWNLSHGRSPRWHFFTLIYVDSEKQTAEAQARQKLLTFASRLQAALQAPIKTARSSGPPAPGP